MSVRMNNKTKLTKNHSKEGKQWKLEMKKIKITEDSRNSHLGRLSVLSHSPRSVLVGEAGWLDQVHLAAFLKWENY